MRIALPGAARLFLAFTLVVLGAADQVAAQTANGDALTLRAAAMRAATEYPGALAAAADRESTTASIELARQAYRPRVDGLLQLNRATHNNVSGLLFPQSVVSPISGPPAPANSPSLVWGTAVGALVTWEPFDFGSRRAAVEAAVRSDERAWFAAERAKLESAATAADAYLSVLASDQAVRAAEAAVTRTDTLLTVVRALVEADLRPGVDLTTAIAERASAAMQLTQARRAADVARATLAQFTGSSSVLSGVPPATAPALTSAPAPSSTTTSATASAITDGDDGSKTDGSASPLVRERAAARLEAEARVEAARRSADPHVAVQGTVYGRGTGVVDGVLSGSGLNGLGLEAYNYAVGVTVAVPLSDIANRGARQAVERARVKAASAREDEAKRDLTRRITVAQRELEAARELATQVPAVVEAARAAQSQATARYQAGLSGITDVADAQRRLAQAEIDAALVDLSVWRAIVTLQALAAADADAFVSSLPDRP